MLKESPSNNPQQFMREYQEQEAYTQKAALLQRKTVKNLGHVRKMLIVEAFGSFACAVLGSLWQFYMHRYTEAWVLLMAMIALGVLGLVASEKYETTSSNYAKNALQRSYFAYSYLFVLVFLAFQFSAVLITHWLASSLKEEEAGEEEMRQESSLFFGIVFAAGIWGCTVYIGTAYCYLSLIRIDQHRPLVSQEYREEEEEVEDAIELQSVSSSSSSSSEEDLTTLSLS